MNEITEIRAKSKEYGRHLYLHFKGEIFLKVLDDHDQKWQLDTKCLLGISWTSDERCAGKTNFHKYCTQKVN